MSMNKVCKECNGEITKYRRTVFCNLACKHNWERRNPYQYTHGMSLTRFYKIWTGMKQRCTNPGATNYKIYGGRNIGFSERWGDFLCFRGDMYDAYRLHTSKHGESNTTLDRIDVNGDYCPENCRWATHKKQRLNTRSTIRSACGKHTLVELAEAYGIKYTTISSRWFSGARTVKELTKKVQTKKAGHYMRRVALAKEITPQLSQSKLGKLFGVSQSMIFRILKKYPLNND